jgi:hypothetical protein
MYYYDFDHPSDSYQEGTVNITNAHLTIHGGQPAPVPIPTALYLLGIGLIGPAGLRRKLKK